MPDENRGSGKTYWRLSEPGHIRFCRWLERGSGGGGRTEQKGDCARGRGRLRLPGNALMEFVVRVDLAEAIPVRNRLRCIVPAGRSAYRGDQPGQHADESCCSRIVGYGVISRRCRSRCRCLLRVVTCRSLKRDRLSANRMVRSVVCGRWKTAPGTITAAQRICGEWRQCVRTAPPWRCAERQVWVVTSY